MAIQNVKAKKSWNINNKQETTYEPSYILHKIGD